MAQYCSIDNLNIDCPSGRPLADRISKYPCTLKVICKSFWPILNYHVNNWLHYLHIRSIIITLYILLCYKSIAGLHRRLWAHMISNDYNQRRSYMCAITHGRTHQYKKRKRSRQFNLWKSFRMQNFARINAKDSGEGHAPRPPSSHILVRRTH